MQTLCDSIMIPSFLKFHSLSSTLISRCCICFHSKECFQWLGKCSSTTLIERIYNIPHYMLMKYWLMKTNWTKWRGSSKWIHTFQEWLQRMYFGDLCNDGILSFYNFYSSFLFIPIYLNHRSFYCKMNWQIKKQNYFNNF